MVITSTYALNERHTLPARSSAAIPLKTAQKLTVINTYGTQVIDFWAFQMPWETATPPATQELTTYLSMSHTRASNLRLTPVAPCTLHTNLHTPILKFLSDTSGAIHDTIIPACDINRYHNKLGVPKDTYHPNCADNCREGLARDTPGFILPAPWNSPTSNVPDPLNLFMNIPVKPLEKVLHESNTTAGGKLSFEPSVSPEGGKVVFEAMVDCIVVMSCCPQDLTPINHGVVRDCHFVVEA